MTEQLIIPNWHPLFVHFTVALLSVAAILFLLSKFATHWRLEDQWLATAYWSLWIGVLITIGTVIAGFVAFNSVKHDDPSHLVMLDHRLWALVTASIFVVGAVWGIVQYKSQTRPGAIFLLLMLVGLIGLGGTAWRGGELVFRHGLGVMSLPNPDKHGHAAGVAHDHGPAAAAADDHHGDAMSEGEGHVDDGHHDEQAMPMEPAGDHPDDGHSH